MNLDVRAATGQAGAVLLAGGGVAALVRPKSATAVLTVSRTSAADCRFREIFVSLDGDEFAILGFGETVTKEIPSGPHRIKAHNTLFWKTHDVVFAPGEHARFAATNTAGWGSFGFLMVLGAAPLYLTFERDASA